MKPLGVTASLFGAASLTAGIMAIASDASTLSIAAGVLGALAGVTGLIAVRTAQYFSKRLTRAEGQLVELEAATADQIQARLSAEASLDQSPSAADARIPRLLADRLPVIRGQKAGSGGALTDAETGVFGEDYFVANVDSRVANARRHLRPVFIALVEIVEDVAEGSPAPFDPKAVTELLYETLRDADTVCRLTDGRFALILEDTPETGAIWVIERFRRELNEQADGLTIWAGLAGYPANANNADSVICSAETALLAAREWGCGRIEVASST